MNKYLYWFSAFAVLALGIYLASLVSIQPQTLTKVPLSQYEVPEDLGRAAYMSLQKEVLAAPLIMFGVTPNQIEDLEFIRGFFEANQQPSSQYGMIVVEPQLPYVELFETAIRIDIKEDMARFVEGVKKAQAEGLRVAVIVPNIYSSQLLKGNPVMRLKQEFGLSFLTISVAKFPVTRQQEEKFEPACILAESENHAKTGELGCMIQNLARKTYKEKFEDNKFSGLTEKVGPEDYLILLNRNAGSK